MKLNLGSGRFLHEGYTNIDGENYEGVVVMDIRELPYEDESVEEVYSKDVLEHFGWREWRGVLAEWVRVIEPGGVIKLRFPDTDKLIASYQNTIIRISERDWTTEEKEKEQQRNFDRFIQLLFGNQDFLANTHLTGLRAEIVKKELEKLGMIVLPYWYDGGRDCRMTATKGEPKEGINLVHPA